MCKENVSEEKTEQSNNQERYNKIAQVTWLKEKWKSIEI